MASNPDFLTDNELAILEADGAPMLAQILRTQQTAILNLSGTVTELHEDRQQQLAKERAKVESEVQDAIDVNHTLASWQTAEDQSMWNKAAAIDQTLRDLPEYRGMPFADRFKKVVELTEAAVDVRPRDDPEEVEARREAERRGSINGLDGMSTVEIAQQFAGKSLDQIESFLAELRE